MSGAGSSQTKPQKFVSPGGYYLGEGLTPFGRSPEELAKMGGFFGDVGAQQISPVSQLFGNFPEYQKQAEFGGDIQRGLGVPAWGQAFAGANQIADSAMNGPLGGLIENTGQFVDRAGGYLDRTDQMMGGINRAQKGLRGAIGNAQQIQSNVMNPTAYNPMFQNAMANQLTPTINSAYAARGLASSGPAAQAISEGGRDLSNQFAQRQFQEQLGASQNLGGLLGQQGQLGVAGGQLGLQASQAPGQIYNQFQQGLGQGLQSQQSANLGPLQALMAGGENFAQGMQHPLDTILNIFNMTRQPMRDLAGFVSGTPTLSNQNQNGLISSLFK